MASKREIADTNFMMLAAVAALLVGIFAVYLYRNKISLPFGMGTKTMTVVLAAQNKSGEEGTATLTEKDGKTTVKINLTGAPKGVKQPAHIHLGSCPNPGEIKHNLEFPVDGASETVLDTTFGELNSLGKLAINVHKSVSAAKVYVSCGDLVY